MTVKRTAPFANLREIRADGKAIPEGMSPEDVFRLSGKPERGGAVQWEYEGQDVTLREDRGFTAEIVKGRRYLVIKPLTDPTGLSDALRIVDQQGRKVHELAPIVSCAGESKAGMFCWSESRRDVRENEFDVIFQPNDGLSMVRVRYDASTGEVKTVAAYR